jgi:hypothetical protein
MSVMLLTITLNFAACYMYAGAHIVCMVWVLFSSRLMVLLLLLF